jgi:transcriptional regulator with XRE-family HTH domain
MRRVIPKPFPVDQVLSDAHAIAMFIRAARTQSGLTLEDAALLTGIAKSTMQINESDPSTVGFATVLRVARELGVSQFAFPSEQQELVRRITNRPQPGSF